jgi:hypothetical protein
MPASIDPGDRRLLLIGGAILLVLTVGLAFVGIDPQEQGVSIPSTYSSGSGGARAAYLLLQDLHYKVSRWERSPTELPSDPEDVVLILAEPLETPTKEEREALQGFVEEGGQVLFSGASIKSFFPDANVNAEIPTLEWKTFPATFPSNYTFGAPKIVLQTGGAFPRRRKLANRGGKNPLVGGGHTPDEFRYFARRKSQSVPERNELSHAWRPVASANLLG